MELISLPNSDIRVYKQFIKATEFWQSLQELDWQYKTIKMGNKTCIQNRQTYLCGDKGVQFKYSGTNTIGDGIYPDDISRNGTPGKVQLLSRKLLCRRHAKYRHA